MLSAPAAVKPLPMSMGCTVLPVWVFGEMKFLRKLAPSRSLSMAMSAEVKTLRLRPNSTS